MSSAEVRLFPGLLDFTHPSVNVFGVSLRPEPCGYVPEIFVDIRSSYRGFLSSELLFPLYLDQSDAFRLGYPPGS